VAYPVLRASRMDHRRYNGAALLGLRGLVFKSHGSADALAFEQAMAARMMRRATSCWTACRAASPMRCPCCNPGRWRRGLIKISARPMTRRFSRITGTGSYLPARRVTNDDLVAELAQRGIETSDEWIVERTGIHARHFAAPDVGASDLAVPAAQAALQAAGRQASDIDLIIVATSTPDMVFPSTAAIVQHKLGIAGCPAFDVQAVCSGFVYALTVADAMIASGTATRALVIGAEVFSRILDFNDRTTCVLFGDGAGAVVLEASDEPGILATDLHADGSTWASCACPAMCRAGRCWAIRCSRWTGRRCSSWPWACWTRPRARCWTRPACRRATSTG
jgi:hypothetical protein